MVKASKLGWRKNEPTRIPVETTNLFEQLTIRAINEDDISIQRGAELLNTTYNQLEHMLHAQEA